MPVNILWASAVCTGVFDVIWTKRVGIVFNIIKFGGGKKMSVTLAMLLACPLLTLRISGSTGTFPKPLSAGGGVPKAAGGAELTFLQVPDGCAKNICVTKGVI